MTVVNNSRLIDDPVPAGKRYIDQLMCNELFNYSFSKNGSPLKYLTFYLFGLLDYIYSVNMEGVVTPSKFRQVFIRAS